MHIISKEESNDSLLKKKAK